MFGVDGIIGRGEVENKRVNFKSLLALLNYYLCVVDFDLLSK